MISNDTFNYNFSKNPSISLAMLIKEYCGVEYEIKGEMHNLMSHNPYLWKERPISRKLNFYFLKITKILFYFIKKFLIFTSFNFNSL